jgi:hypothetical protein
VRLWDLLTDGDLKDARSKAEVIRTVASVVAMICTVGSFIILVAVHVL